jgi:hypothetical protein
MAGTQKTHYFNFIDPHYAMVKEVDPAAARRTFEAFNQTLLAEIPSEGAPQDGYMYNAHMGAYVRALDVAKDHFVKAKLAFYAVRGSSRAPDEKDGGDADRKRKAAEEGDAPAAKKTKIEQYHRVFLRNLPPAIDEDKLREAFKSCGEITDIALAPRLTTDQDAGTGFAPFASYDGTGTGFLQFATFDGAAAAVGRNNMIVLGYVILVDYASAALVKAFAPRWNPAAAGAFWDVLCPPSKED